MYQPVRNRHLDILCYGHAPPYIRIATMYCIEILIIIVADTTDNTARL